MSQNDPQPADSPSRGGMPGGDFPAPQGRTAALRPTARRLVLLEVMLLWLGVNLLIRGILALQQGLGLHPAVQALVPFLFIYAPVGLCRLRRVDSYSYKLYIPAFRDIPAWSRALGINVRLLALGLVPWLLAYHLYQTGLFGVHPTWQMPDDLPTVMAYHLFFVAIPEEFFYRGYIQTRLNEVFPRRFMVAGIPFGYGMFIATIMFAFGHSLVEFQWWHFATFFPGLLFALLRERTGGIMAGAFCHAACNIVVYVQDTIYGLR